MANTNRYIVPMQQTAADKPSLSRRDKWLIFLTLASCMLGAALLSVTVLIRQSLRLDEAQTIWQSSHSLSGVLHTVALDVHVPLYHIMVHYWMFFFGESPPAVRSLSLLFFIATIPVVFLIARQILTLRWALFAVVLFSFSPFMSWYASEARMYTLLGLMASLNLYFFMKIARTGRGWIGFTLSTLIGVYAHYFFIFSLASEALYYLLMRRQFARRSLPKFILVAITAAAVLSPWLYYFHSLGSASGTRPLLAKPSSVDFSNVFSQFIFGFQTDTVNTIILSAWPVIMLLSLLAIRRRGRLTRSSQLAIVTAMGVLPVVLAFVVSLVITPFFLSRYMVACVAPLLIAAVWVISQYRPIFARFAAALMIVGLVASSYQQAHSAATPVKEDYRAAAQYIDSQVVPQDLVVISAPFTIYPIEYYYNGSAQIETLPHWDRSANGTIPAFSKAALAPQVTSYNKDHRYIYLVLSQDQGYEDTIYQYYLQHFKQVDHKTFSDDLSVYVYQVGYYTVPPLHEATQPVTQ